MIVAIPELEGQVNQHFGRSSSFAIIEIENGHVKGVNLLPTTGLEHNHAGIAKLLLAHQVTEVITGGIGQGMVDALEGSGFKVVRGASGNIKDIAELYARGELVSKGQVCNHHHHHHS